MQSSGLMTISIVAALAGIGIWRQVVKPPQADIAVGIDPSLSVERNCSGVRSAVRGLLARPGIEEGSTLSALVMGTSPLAPDPELRYSAPIPIPSDQVNGRAKREQEYAQQLDEMLDGLEGACEQMESAQHTPLYQLIEQGLGHLRAGGSRCRPDGRCYFLIKSDLLEDVHPTLRAVMTEAVTDPGAAVPADLAGSLDNAGVEIVFCGVAEIRPPGKKASAPPPASVRERIWRELFTAPELVSFQPYCASAGSPR